MDQVLSDLEYQVRTRPDTMAVFDGDMKLTYQQLDNVTNQIAATISSSGIKPGDILAYMGSTGLKLVLSLVAAQKAGAAFLPLNSANPESFIFGIMKHAGVASCVVDADWEKVALPASVGLIVLPDIMVKQEIVTPFEIPRVNKNSIGLIYFTSGTSGNPKGVPHTRQSVGYFTRVHKQMYDLSEHDRVAHLGIFWIESILAALSSGAILSCIDVSSKGPLKLFEWLHKGHISVLPLYPALYRLLVKVKGHLPDLRHITVSGESLTRADAEAFEHLCPPNAVLANCYASNELPWISTYFHHHGEDIKHDWLPIGYPVEPHVIRIIDESGLDLPVGAEGEMVIISPFVPSGYLNDSDRSSSVFSCDPDGTGIIYTGDIAFRDLDGALHYIGRKDEQVKIRGYTLRPEDIEQELMTHSEVSLAAVVAFECSRGIRRLACHYVGTEEPKVMKDFLAKKLPAYMVPQIFVPHQHLPFTASGKIQKNRLQLPNNCTTLIHSDFKSSKTRQIADIWKNILGHNNFGSDDDFFDIGGDSLQAMEMVLEIEKVFGSIIRVETLILEGSTITSLAALCRKDAKPEQGLRQLKLGTGQASLYIAHTRKGGVNSYLPLVHSLNREISIFGVIGDYKNKASDYSLKAQAVKAVAQLPESSSITLMGFSYGALVAFEIARQIPDRIKSLILIDPFTPFIFQTFWRRFKIFLFHWKRYVLGLPYEKKKLTLLLPELYLYRPKPIRLKRSVIFKTKHRTSSEIAAWRRLLGSKLEIFDHPGDHSTIMKDPNARLLAQRINVLMKD